MRKGTKMMLMTSRNNRGDYGRSNYEHGEGGEMNYGPYNNQRGPYNRGNRTNTEYENTRSEYNGTGMNYGVEGRFRDRRGREHYDNGRFSPMKGEMDEDEWEGEGQYPYPVWSNPMAMMPGFSVEPGFRMGGGKSTGYEKELNMNHKKMGHGSEVEFTPEMAKEWTKNMVNEDGTKGPHWPFEQAKQVMTRRGIVCDPYTFWAVLNALYSDYCAVAKKHGINGVDFFADLAAAWLNDKDAKGNKAALYYECIVK